MNKANSQPMNCGCQLIVNELAVTVGTKNILRNISFQADRGEFIALLGPSGSGKTTLLRALAGFLDIGHGSIGLRDNRGIWQDISKVPAQKRPVAMVFQDLALYPHMTVLENVAYGADKRKSREEHIALLGVFNIESLADRYPHQLSGGQQQRLALARAIAGNPEILLLDEPFANLDSWLREPLSREIKRILKERDITTIMVTHDVAEAFALADKMVIMFEGSIKQIGEPQRIYAHPISTFVARFIGNNQIIRGKVIPGGWAKTVLGLVSLEDTAAYKEGQHVYILVRPSDIKLEEKGDTCAVVTSFIAQGNSFLMNLSLANGETVYCRVDGKKGYSVGQPVIISVSDAALPVYNDYI